MVVLKNNVISCKTNAIVVMTFDHVHESYYTSSINTKLIKIFYTYSRSIQHFSIHFSFIVLQHIDSSLVVNDEKSQ